MNIYAPLPPDEHCKRLGVPKRVFDLVWKRQAGHCCDCPADLTTVKYIKEHEPPIWMRPKGSDPNDPDKLFLRCVPCDKIKTNGVKHRPRSGDKGKIAHVRAVRKTHGEFLNRMATKQCGQKREKTGSIRGRGFDKGHRPLRSRGFQKRAPK